MAKLTPVDYDPFQQAGPTLTPVDYDPFADRKPAMAPEPEYNAAEDMPWHQQALVGFGKSGMDTYRGIKQLLGGYTPEEIEEMRRIDAPLMDTGWGMAGNIAGQTAQIAVPVPAGAAAKSAAFLGKAAPYASAAVRAGAFGALQPVGEDESRGRNAAKGAALAVAGQKVANLVGSAAKGAVAKLEPGARKLAERAKELGIPLGIPNISENPMVRTLASQMERIPFSGGGKRAEKVQEAFNRAVSSTFGKPVSKVTPDVMAEARRYLSNGFEKISARNSLQLGVDDVAQIRALTDEAGRLGGKDMGGKLSAWVDDLVSRVGKDGAIPGKAYQSFDSKLGGALKSGGESAHYLDQLRDLVRGAMDRSISPQDKAAWAMLRQRWANLKTVEPLAREISSTGNIPPAQLMGRVTADKAGKARVAYGNSGELGELAAIGQRFLKSSPNSGTADRALVNMGVGGGLYMVSPEVATAAGIGVLANRAGLGVLNSPALAMGQSRTLQGLARLSRTAPYLLPASANAADD